MDQEEIRGVITDNHALQKFRENNTKKENYTFTDIIYENNAPLTTEYIRIRCYGETGQNQPVAKVQRKTVQKTRSGKKSMTELEEHFDSQKAAETFLENTYPNAERALQYARIGEYYVVDNINVSIEIFNDETMVEVEGAGKEAQGILLDLNIETIITDPLPVHRAEKED